MDNHNIENRQLGNVDQDFDQYPNEIITDEPEEENPTAYALLAKIEDPYYSVKDQPPNPSNQMVVSNEHDPSNIQVYKSFYSNFRPKADSYDNTNSTSIDPISEATEENKVPLKPLKKYVQKIFQEPKRHASCNVATHNKPETPLSTYSKPYVPQFHRDGVSTPPPGLGYYNGTPQILYYQPYDPNGYPQGVPYGMSGYYPPYMNYQPFQSPQDFYKQQQPSLATPKKKSSKPSQFRPHLSSFNSKDHNFGEHNAENEGEITSVIIEFEQSQNNLSVLKGKISELAVTQTGSRFLQRQLTKSSPEFIDFILTEVEETLPNMMVDNYANYFCQRLLSSCSQPQRVYFIQKVF